MLLYIIITVMVCAMSYRIVWCPKQMLPYGISRQQLLNKVCIISIFITLFLLSSLRIGMGIDYKNYVRNFHEVYVGGIVATEWGYNLLVKTIYSFFSWENYIVVFAFFAFVTIYFFLKGIYEQSTDFFMSIVLFMTLGIYFNSLNTIRYYLALSVALYSMKYVIKKEYAKFILSILCIGLFHKSAFIVIPFYFIAMIPWKKWHIAMALAGCISLVVLKDLYLDIFIMLYPSYKNTVFLNGEISVINILRCIAVVIFGALYYKKAIVSNRANRFYYNLNILALGLYTFGTFIPLVSRIGYYFTVSQIILIPNIYKSIDNKKQKKVFGIIILFCAICYFTMFLKGASANDLRLLPYDSWIFYTKGGLQCFFPLW